VKTKQSYQSFLILTSSKKQPVQREHHQEDPSQQGLALGYLVQSNQSY